MGRRLSTGYRRGVIGLVGSVGAVAIILAVTRGGGLPPPDDQAADGTTLPPTTALPETSADPPATDDLPAVDLPEPDQPADRVLSGEEYFPDGLTVPEGEVWEFDPDQATTLVSEANVVVEGVLRMRPAEPDVQHTLRFEGIDESRVVGADAEPAHEDGSHEHGAHSVSDTDIGLWVVEAGQLDLEGSERAGWNRDGDAPGWQPEDDIRVTPTEPGDSTDFAPFTPGDPVPTVAHADQEYRAEVFNLTRNVLIEGTGDGEADPATNGRAHVHITSSRPQSIRYAELAHLGPRHSADGASEGALGRYALHFHMAGEGSRGSIVEGVVVRDSGNRAFVPHASHGITFRDTVAYNVFGDAYWWDPNDTGHGEPGPNGSEDVTYDHAMAAYVRSDPDYRGYVLTGFQLGEGRNLTVTDSVAVGVQGNNTASGFHWPATANGNENNLWEFRDNVAHNNRISGIFVWQNDGNDHLVEDFVGYRNGAYGIDHGAYRNNYTYDGLTLFGNGEAGIRTKAAATDRPQTWRDVDTDSILIADRALDSSSPTVFEDLVLRGPIVVDELGDNPSGRAVYEFHDATTGDGTPLSDSVFQVDHQESEITIYHGDGTSSDV